MSLKNFFNLLLVIILLLATIFYIKSRSKHDTIFQNLDPKYKPKRFLNLLKWKLTTKHPVWPKKVLVENYDLPPHKVIDQDKIRISFVGHVTFLIQTNEINILTDPVWSQRASPFSFIGPKRVIDPGIKLADLPKIDIIVISHNHYDHMDLATIKTIWQRDKPKIITPLLNDQILKNYIKDIKVTTLDWHENILLPNNIAITLEPAQHWSARGLFDLNKSLWGNFMIKTPAGTICFIGDSGYNQELYNNIGIKYDVFLSLIPIGAFEPRWFMQDIHMNPEEAALVHQHLKSKHSIASHFQTFPLASDQYFQASEELSLALQKYQISKEQFIIPTAGKVYWFNNQKKD